jgi:2'-5' RNA ligase
MARNEHLVVIMLEPTPPGEEFEIWPMHITIVPWFTAEDIIKLDKLLSDIAAKHKSIKVKAGRTEKWGGSEKFDVLKLTSKTGLHRLHWDVFKNLEKNGFNIHQKDYMGEKYTPHITLRNSLSDNTRYKYGEIIDISNFTLIKQLRLKGSGRMIKTPVKNYELG